jgi:hypothetical protein
MTGKTIDKKECFGKKSMKIFDWEKRFSISDWENI